VKSLLAPLLRNDTPVQYAPRSAGITWPWSQRTDATAQIKAMGSVGTLFNIVSTTSQAVAEVEWKLWRKAKSGKAEDRTEVTAHPALDIWQKPNKFMTRQELVESVQQHLDLTGEGWCVVARNPRARTIPLELWPVRPDRMAPVPSPTNYIVGYVYTNPDGESVPFEPDSVLFMRMPNPDDAYRGMGPVQSILMDIDSSKYSAQWNRNFFLNSAQPGGVIEVDKRLSDDEFLELTTRWREQHQGIANAHRVAVLEQGKWVDRQMNMRDMQFVELRSVAKETIREAFGFPKFAAGEVDDVNRATADASAAWFARRLTVPRLSRWKGMLNNDFLPLFGTAGQNLEFDYENPVSEDQTAEDAERTSKATAAKTYIVDCGFEPEPVLEYLELPSDWKVAEKPEPEPPAMPVPGPGEGQPPAGPGQQQPPQQGGSMPTEQVAALLSLVMGARARDDDRYHDDRPFRRREYFD
jgi:HK97 family phage portal protein